MKTQIMNLKKLGFDVEVDTELRTIKIKQFEDCKCCDGIVNLCDGDMCEHMGLCVCI
jgi:hypothetical protein